MAKRTQEEDDALHAETIRLLEIANGQSVTEASREPSKPPREFKTADEFLEYHFENMRKFTQAYLKSEFTGKTRPKAQPAPQTGGLLGKIKKFFPS